MTNGEKIQLIISYQEDYAKRTGEHIKVMPCSKWESLANFTDKVEFWTLVKMIFDFTGWKKSNTLEKGKGSQKASQSFARSLIFFTAVNNGCTYNTCAKASNRDHSVIITSVSGFENRLDTEIHTKKFFYEVMEFIRGNYHLYVDQIITEENLEGGS